MATIEITVYGLYDKRDLNKKVMYIGQTIQSLNIRLSVHKSDSKNKNYPVSRWVKGRKSVGIKPLIKNAVKNIDEIRMIKKHKKKNPKLLNVCEGVGTTGHRWTLDKQARKNISEGHKGLKLSKEHKENTGKGNKGKKRSPEVIEGMRARGKITGQPKGGLQKGDTHTKEARKKMSESRKGKSKSPEHKESMRLAALKRWAKVKENQQWLL